MNDTVAPCLHQASWLSHRLANAFATRRERVRFRWELKRMAKANPHLIDDIGLTRRQVEAEIARLPFWQR